MNITLVGLLTYFFVVVIGVALIAFLFRLVKFLLIAFFGRNLTITYIDKSGQSVTRKFRLDQADDLVALVDAIKGNKDLEERFFGGNH